MTEPDAYFRALVDNRTKDIEILALNTQIAMLEHEVRFLKRLNDTEREMFFKMLRR